MSCALGDSTPSHARGTVLVGGRALILTSDRLLFLPYVDHPRLSGAAFWLHDVPGIERTGRDRLAARAVATFQFAGSGAAPKGPMSDQAAVLVAAIEAAQPAARPRVAFERAARRVAG